MWYMSLAVAHDHGYLARRAFSPLPAVIMKLQVVVLIAHRYVSSLCVLVRKWSARWRAFMVHVIVYTWEMSKQRHGAENW